MRVLINGLVLSDFHSGVEHSVWELLRGLAQIAPRGVELEVLLNMNQREGVEALPEAYWGRLKFRFLRVHGGRMGRVLVEQLRLGGFARAGSDLFFGPAYVLPLRMPVPSVLLCHDLIALDHPALCKRSTALYYGWGLKRSLHQASKVVVPSHFVREGILDRWPALENKVVIIPHGLKSGAVEGEQVGGGDSGPVLAGDLPAGAAVRARFNLPDHFLLFLGNLENKKNIPRLIAAWAGLFQQGIIQSDLVLAGGKGWGFSNIEAAVRASGLSEHIHFTGYVPEAWREALLGAADLFVFPSLVEGFGLPVLEALACGTAVVAGNRGGIPAISAGLAVLVEPDSVPAIAEGIVRGLEVPPGFAARARRHARGFSWLHSAEAYLQLFDGLGHGL